MAYRGNRNPPHADQREQTFSCRVLARTAFDDVIWPGPTRPPFKMVISHHQDGELIAQTIGMLGFGSIGGSSSRGGVGAVRAMLRALKAGECVGVTPDGPRGPRMQAAQGRRVRGAACRGAHTTAKLRGERQ